MKKPDYTKIATFAKLPWKEIPAAIRSCGHMLAFGQDAWALPVVKTFTEDDGHDDAGMACLVAALYCQKHGPCATAMTASRILKEIAIKHNFQELRMAVHNLEFMVYFAARETESKDKWPLVWPYEDDDRRGRLANVMLGIAHMRLSQTASMTTCETIAAMGVQTFLEEDLAHIARGGCHV